MLERPDGAPPDWGQEHTEAEVRELVLDLSPDIVAFQELPGLVPYCETHDMIRANPRSHSGNLATLVGHDLMEEHPSTAVVDRCGLLTTFPERGLTVANVHLAPGRAGAQTRIEQLAAVAETSPTDDLVIIGDTNTRLDEQDAIRALGLDGELPPAPTWDSERNRFRATGPRFVAYFTRHFERGRVTVRDVEVLSGRPVDVAGRRFHLSDHYPLHGTIVARTC